MLNPDWGLSVWVNESVGGTVLNPDWGLSVCVNESVGGYGAES